MNMFGVPKYTVNRGCGGMGSRTYVSPLEARVHAAWGAMARQRRVAAGVATCRRHKRPPSLGCGGAGIAQRWVVIAGRNGK
jgi:hypothetical protein